MEDCTNFLCRYERLVACQLEKESCEVDKAAIFPRSRSSYPASAYRVGCWEFMQDGKSFEDWIAILHALSKAAHCAVS